MTKALFAILAATAALPALAQPPAAPPAPAPAPTTATQPRAATPTGPYTLRGQLTLYEMVNFNGDSWMTAGASRSVRTDWPIKSLSVHPGDRWQVCARTSFRDCVVIDRSVPDASTIGIVNQIGSARPAPAE